MTRQATRRRPDPVRTLSGSVPIGIGFQGFQQSPNQVPDFVVLQLKADQGLPGQRSHRKRHDLHCKMARQYDDENNESTGANIRVAQGSTSVMRFLNSRREECEDGTTVLVAILSGRRNSWRGPTRSAGLEMIRERTRRAFTSASVRPLPRGMPLGIRAVLTPEQWKKTQK
jgi:hypothetical protein